MNQSTTIEDVISTLQTLIKSGPSLKNINTNATKQPILPSSIPEKPKSETSLPENASSNPLTTTQSHLIDQVLPFLNQSSLSPNYYGFVTGGTTPAALLADFITSIYDQNVAVHLPHETIATNLEVVALNLLVQLFHLPSSDWGIGTKTGGGGGTFTTGATASNFLGLALGREYVLSKAVEKKTGRAGQNCGDYGVLQLMKLAQIDGIQVLSSLPHSSVGKVASMVGIGRNNVISIANASKPWEVDIEALQRELSKDPNIVHILVISSGEVNTGRYATGSLETMQQIRRICDEHGAWIHVDGAFGLFGRILTSHPKADTDYTYIVDGVRGLELADSITGDAHKLLNVPYDCGFFFTRHKKLSEAVFNNGNAAYLKSSSASDGEIEIQSPLNIGIENSRRFRALPVYTTLMTYGREGYVDMLDRQISLARKTTAWLLEDPRFEVLPTYQAKEEALLKTFMILLFRARDPVVNEKLVKRINGTGQMYVSGTMWEGKAATRIAVSNWRVDVERDFRLIVNVLDEVVGEVKRT